MLVVWVDDGGGRMIDTFTSRHEADLVWFFSGGFAGDCGMRSNAGPQLDAIAATAQSDLGRAPAWDGHSEPPPQTITCRPSRSGASAASTEMGPEAMAAARRERIVRGALEQLHEVDRRVLMGFYRPMPSGYAEGLAQLGELRAVIVEVLSKREAMLALVRRAYANPAPKDATREERDRLRQERTQAKREVARYIEQARRLVASARAAYAVAAANAVRAEREERARRFVRGMR